MTGLDLLILVVLLAWLGGFSLHVGGLIHLLLVVALVMVIARLVTGRRV